MYQRSQIADILSFFVAGAILYLTLKLLVFGLITAAGWLCLSTVGRLVQPGGESFNLAHGLLTLGCVFALMIGLTEGVKRAVRRVLAIKQ